MIIYKTINLLNNKIYIGQDYRNYPKYLGGGQLIKKAIKKYGRENFKKEILEHCNSKEEMKSREIYWIQFYNSKPPIGYNLSDGGESTLGYKFTKEQIKRMKKVQTGIKHPTQSQTIQKLIKEGKWIGNHKGYKMSKESIKKISKANTGKKKHTEESKKKISEALKGSKYSEETKQKMSQALKGRKFSKEWLENKSKAALKSGVGKWNKKS